MSEDYPYSEIGERLKQLRGDIGQTEFARLIHVSPPQYNRYERGKLKPPREILEKISHVRSISVDWILTGEAIPSEEKVRNALSMISYFMDQHESLGVIPRGSISDDEMAIVRCMRLLMPKDAVRLLKTMVEMIEAEPSSMPTEYDLRFIKEVKAIIDRGGDYPSGVDLYAISADFSRIIDTLKVRRRNKKRPS